MSNKNKKTVKSSTSQMSTFFRGDPQVQGKLLRRSIIYVIIMAIVTIVVDKIIPLIITGPSIQEQVNGTMPAGTLNQQMLETGTLVCGIITALAFLNFAVALVRYFESKTHQHEKGITK